MQFRDVGKKKTKRNKICSVGVKAGMCLRNNK